MTESNFPGDHWSKLYLGPEPVTTYRQPWVGKIFLPLLGCALISVSARAFVPTDVEPTYSSAVLAFHSKDYAGSLRLLDEVLARYPKQPESTELKALALKAAGQTDQAIALLKDLLSRPKEGEDDGAYRFELGALYFGKKSYPEAARYLNQAVRQGFNVGPAHYFLGTIDYQEKRYPQSEAHFQAVLEKGGGALKAPAHLYLAELSNVASDRANTVFHYYRARDFAFNQLSDPTDDAEGKQLAKQIVDSVNKVIGVMDRPTVFGSVGTISGYDSNVLFTPSGVSSPSDGPSGRGSLRQFLNAEVGYSSSPLADVQFSPVFRSSLNYNFNRSLAAGQFFSNDFSLLIAHKPLAASGVGVRLGATGAFRYTLDSATGLSRFRTYSLLGSIAPYAKFALGGRWGMIVSFTYSPQRFFLDSETTTQFFKTGADYAAEVNFRQDRGHALWNPSASLRGNIHYARGTEYRGRGLEVEFGNQMFLSERSALALFAILGSSSFKDRPDGPRFDVNLAGGVAFQYRPSWPVLLFANLEYQKNNSNVALPYEFSRYLFNLGASYRF